MTALGAAVPLHRTAAATRTRPAGPPTPRLRRSLLVGATCGVAWAAALRGWMIQLAGPDTTFTWFGTVSPRD
jgi:hypothetical protein